jgi:hypothetical protein
MERIVYSRSARATKVAGVGRWRGWRSAAGHPRAWRHNQQSVQLRSLDVRQGGGQPDEYAPLGSTDLAFVQLIDKSTD